MPKHVGFNNNFHKTNEIGLQKAYKANKYLYVDGDTMYVAGSQTARDWWDDFTKIPVWGDSRKIQRYQDARDELSKHPEVKNIVGHSLGGSVALQLEKDNPSKFTTTTYNAPVFEPWATKPAENRFRTAGDLVSSYDTGAITIEKFASPLTLHSYKGFA